MAQEKQHEEQAHGRYADKPSEIPRRGWWDITKRVKQQISEDNLSIVSAGVAFFGFLAVFPAIAALISIYGLVVDPQTVERQLSEMSGFLPAQAQELVGGILRRLAGSSSGALGWGLAASIALALWSANKGTRALFTGLNIGYDQEENRGFFKLNAITLLTTLCIILFVIVALALVVGLPAALGTLELPGAVRTAVSWGRWLVLAVLILVALTALYRYAPNRTKAQWKWVTWGSAIATVLWLAGSWAFSFYVANFGSYDATYGSLAAVVILLFWFYLSSYVVLLGAEINAEMEHQTKKDSTVEPEKPMGKRGAYPADDLGKAA